MPSLSRRAKLVVAVCLLIPYAVGTTPPALSVTPSLNWYGDDGSWSAISLRVGTPAQWVDVMVSTVSSETWLVGNYGCPQSPSDCSTLRGGLFTHGNSSSWHPKGFFEFGVDQRLGNSGYAEYGLDAMRFGSSSASLPSAIIGVFNDTGMVNTTQNFLGYFGLGLVPGSFDNTSPKSAISALLEDQGFIPSHSYGYTAGASYQQKGVPNSLTLGGYDANRFVSHNVTFTLNPSQNPELFINSISVTNDPNNSSGDLLYASDRVSAVLDSSTPYLWLPKAACDRFATRLNLNYNTTLNLYTYNSTAQYNALQASNMSFVFNLSDSSSSPDQVNITLPYAAFDLKLTFPAIPSTNAGDLDATLPYFPLRQAASEDQYTIGRVFLQEAYLITNYERNTFSVYQAVHPASAIQNSSIISIQPSSSNLSGQPKTRGGMRLSKGAIVGIVIAAVTFTALMTFAIVYYRRRQRRSLNNEKRSTQHRTLIDRLRRHKQSTSYEANGDTTYPTEVPTGPEHERFELPAPFGPVELDSEDGTLEGTTEEGFSLADDSNNISAYERARRKLERQQLAAAHAQGANGGYPVEKDENDVSWTAHYRSPDTPGMESPQVSPVGGGSAGSLTLSNGEPSPVSHGPVSPMAAAPPTYTSINSSNIVYTGRLIGNIRPPHSVLPPDQSSTESTTSSSLPSDYSQNGNPYGSGSTRGPRGSDEDLRNTHTLRSNDGIRDLLDPWGSRRRLEGEDLVHVPQPAENRFSWEEERTHGTD